MFVAQHLNDPVARCRVVEGVVSRHCCHGNELTENERFVIEKLSVSKELIYQAKVGGACCLATHV